MGFNGAVLDLCNRAVLEKNPQIFGHLLPAEYVTIFSEQTDALWLLDLNKKGVYFQTSIYTSGLFKMAFASESRASNWLITGTKTFINEYHCYFPEK